MTPHKSVGLDAFDRTAVRQRIRHVRHEILDELLYDDVIAAS
jgi:hypothetical protein